MRAPLFSAISAILLIAALQACATRTVRPPEPSLAGKWNGAEV